MIIDLPLKECVCCTPVGILNILKNCPQIFQLNLAWMATLTDNDVDMLLPAAKNVKYLTLKGRFAQ